ncbi:hypothetical protein Tco_1137341 [Tanacetum coccineum]
MPPKHSQPSRAHTNVHVDPREEMNELRRQVEILTHRLSQLEPSREEEEFESDDAFQNPFHRHDRHREPPMCNDRRWEASIKVKIPKFSGTLKAEEFIDRLNTIERVFEFENAPENRKVKWVAIKLKGRASAWYVEEYTEEFYELVSRNDLSDSEQQLVSRKERGKKLMMESGKCETYEYEDKVEYTVEPRYDEDDESNEGNPAYGDSGQMLVIRKSLFLPKEEDYENVISQDTLEKLNFKQEIHLKPYKLSWFKKGNEVNIDQVFDFFLNKM